MEAIDQIKIRKYVENVRQHTSEILLIGINYDKDSKVHTCIIEKGNDGWFKSSWRKMGLIFSVLLITRADPFFYQSRTILVR